MHTSLTKFMKIYEEEVLDNVFNSFYEAVKLYVIIYKYIEYYEVTMCDSHLQTSHHRIMDTLTYLFIVSNLKI